MKCSGPVGLVLAATLCLVHSMPTETSTTRYTSFEGYDSFPLQKSPHFNNFLNLSSSGITSHFSEPSSQVNRTGSHFRNAKQPKSDIFYDEILINSLKTSEDFNSRKLTKKKTDETFFNNFFQNIWELATPKKTVKIKTANKIPTKVNKNTTTITTKPVTANIYKIATPKTPQRNTTAIVIKYKNKVDVVATKVPLRTKPGKITTTKATTKVKYKTTTSSPIKIVLTRFTTQKPKSTTHKSTVKVTRTPNSKPTRTSTTTKPKYKPTVHKIITKWTEKVDLSEIKQNWYEEGVPYPNPNPEVSSFSPPISLNDLSSISPVDNDFIDNLNYPELNPEVNSFSPPISLSDVSSISPLDAQDYPSPDPEVLSPYSPSYSLSDVPPIPSNLPPSTPSPTTTVSNPINVFNLDMLPDRTRDAVSGSPCPTVHISSSVLAPRQMQDCSDLNLVINSHFHQNQNSGGTRNPAVSTYDAEDAAAGPVVAEDGLAQADPGVADVPAGTVQNIQPQSVPQAAAPAAPGSGGTGGNGGNGDDAGGGLKFPDLKNMFEAIGYLWNGLGYLLGFLRNPYLYIIPMALFFGLGFFTILALFPWWIPLLLLYLGVKNNKKPKDTVSFYKHVHKPVHHPDGWFWNHQTKTWQNVQDFPHKRVDIGDKRVDNITDLIQKFKSKYANDSTTPQSWKTRRRSK